MIQVLSDLRAYLPMLGAVLAGLGVVALLMLIVYVRKQAAAAKALQATFAPIPPPAMAEQETAPTVSQPDAASPFLTVLDRAPEVMDDLPLVLVLGASGSGKSALLAGAGAVETGSGWWAFDGGMALPVPGAVFLGDQDRDWLRVLDRLRRARRVRPLDGIVLTLAADRLDGSAPAGDAGKETAGKETGKDAGGRTGRDDLIHEARRIWERLSMIQTELGMVVPVSVVVTQTQRVSGFSSFFGFLEPHQQQQMFGWANPFAVEAVYSEQWLQDAVRSMAADLYRARIAIAAGTAAGGPESGGRTSERDLRRISGMIHFPDRLGDLCEGLQGWIGTIFAPSAYVDSLCWRGVWFTGRHGIDGPVILGGDLFRQKIFPERALARPAHRALRAMARSERMLRRGLAVVSVLLMAGLMAASVGQRQEFQSLEPLLTHIRSDLSAQPTERTPEQSARTLLQAMDRVEDGRIGSIFIPASWWGVTQRHLEDYVVRGFSLVVMSAMRQSLDDKVSAALSESSLTVVLDPSRTAGGQPLAQARFSAFMDALDAVNADIRSFNRLGSDGGITDLAPLAHSLLGYTLRQSENSPLLQRAVLQVREDPYQITETQKGRATRLIALHTNAEVAALTTGGEINAALQSIIRIDTDTMSRPEGVEGVVAALADLRRMLKQGWTLPVQRGRLDPSDPLAQLVERTASNDFLGPTVRNRLQAHLGDVLARYREDLLLFRTGSAGAVLTEQPATGLLTIGEGTDKVGDLLQGFLSTSFMQAPRGEALPSSPPAGWDPVALESGLDLYRAYAQWASQDASVIGQPLRGRLVSAAREGTAGAMRRQIILARNPATQEGPDARAMTFSRLAELFALTRSALKAVGGDTAALALGQASRGTAFSVLNHADTRFSASALYQPPGLAQLDYWNGLPAASDVLYGAPDAPGMAVYLEGQAAALRHVVIDLGEAAWLYISQETDLPPPQDDSQRRLIQTWARLYPQVSAYFAGQGSTVRDLTAYLATTLPGITGATCAENLPTLARAQATGDYFLERRQILQTALWSRCDVLDGGNGQPATAYTAMATLFNRTLAGRYPFTASATGHGVPAVTPDDLKTFFQLWTSAAPRFMAELDQRGIAQADRLSAKAFIARMEAVKTFLGPWVDGQDGAGLSVSPAWRPERSLERNANQVLDWSLLVGPETLPSEGGTALWNYGEPVSLNLRWARNSPQVPVAAGTDLTVQVLYQDPWALLSFLRSHPGPAGVLLFDIPIRPAASAGPPLQTGATPSTAATLARLSLGVTLGAPPAKAGAAPVPLSIPVFPTVAPVPGQKTTVILLPGGG